MNLRTQLLRIIGRAGLKPWPKLWHNLRSSRQTELAETYPIHVVCAWLGNSRAVAQEHYLQVRDTHFAQAVGGTPEKAPQKAPQYPAVTSRIKRNSPPVETQNPPFIPEDSAEYGSFRKVSVTPTGFEPVSRP